MVVVAVVVDVVAVVVVAIVVFESKYQLQKISLAEKRRKVNAKTIIILVMLRLSRPGIGLPFELWSFRALEIFNLT